MCGFLWPGIQSEHSENGLSILPDVWGLSQGNCVWDSVKGCHPPRAAGTQVGINWRLSSGGTFNLSTYTSLLQMACASSQHGDWILRCGFQMEAFKEWAPRWWGKLHGLNGLVSELTQHHFYLVVRAVTRPPRFKLSGSRPYFSVKNDNKRAPIWRKKKKTKLHRHSLNTWKVLLSRCSM